MRELKFRGLTANGDMVYGYLVPDLPDSTVYYKEYSQRICWYEGQAHHNIPVKNGTVGQYTGLKDSYSIDEYFGDIIEEKDGVRLIIEDGLSSVWYKNIKTGGGKYFWQLDVHKVIGNIFENPELWEKE